MLNDIRLTPEYKSELKVNTNLVFQFEKPMPNAWHRFWQKFLLGWEWRNLTPYALDGATGAAKEQSRRNEFLRKYFPSIYPPRK